MRRPWVGTLVRDVAPAVWVLALLPVLVYFAVVVGVVPQRDGHRPLRRRADRGANGIGPDGPWAFVPDALRSLWYYSAHVLDFHAG